MKKNLPAKLAAKFYDQIIDLHHEEFNYKNIDYKNWLDLLMSKMNKGDVILDLGCGNGRAMKYFIDRGFEAVGTDVSDRMLKLAKKYVPSGKFYKQEFAKLKFKPNYFNAVISFFALNHVSKAEFKSVIKTSRNILKKDGFLLLGMVKGKDEGYFEGFYDKKLELYGSGYSKTELVDILSLNGFKIIKSEVRHFKGKHFEEDDIYILAKVKK
jgi:ubiquinone/menaquinone biosynthesis C-methylase UbiE